MSGQLDLFGAMGSALMPGDVVQSHGKPLTFDDLMKLWCRLVLVDINSTLTVCRVGECVSVPGTRMFQQSRRMIKLYCRGMEIRLFRADMQGNSPTHVYEL